MIKVEGLTKRYARTVAVDNISFEVEKGQIVGFLGPNGAGKTTTMRVLTCFLPPTEGTANVAGFDVQEHPIEVKRRIGYLPESPPLYPEMDVIGYLEFTGKLKGIPSADIKKRVDEVLGKCAIGDVRDKLIGKLSKGYRQRVGLADALVHEPELLILDEPTLGLDPHQIRAVRQLIKNLAEKHTVLISTHILPEAEMTCNRMLIMYEGKILAADTPDNLQRLMAGSSQIIAEISASAEELREHLAQSPEVVQFDVSAADGAFLRCAITPRDGLDLRPLIWLLARERGWVLRELTRSRHSLEDIYVQITRPKEEEEAE